MIRNAVLHILNEQPLLADLFEAPANGDLGVRCTNLRTLQGRRPVFADDSASTFFFPYLHIRFVEIPPSAMTGGDPEASLAPTTPHDSRDSSGPPASEAERDLDIDEDFLRRIREV